MTGPGDQSARARAAEPAADHLRLAKMEHQMKAEHAIPLVGIERSEDRMVFSPGSSQAAEFGDRTLMVVD